MLAIALFTASLLLFALVFVLARALDYVRQHPEVLVGNVALAYEQCQTMLQQVITRSRELENKISSDVLIAWQAPNGNFYTVSGRGVEEHRPGKHANLLTWHNIGGVGVRMQPGFKALDAYRRARRKNRAQPTTGYSFFLLIVPLSGDTLTIRIPTHEHTDAIDFVAQTLALAGHLKKRINVFGFNRPLRQ